MEILLINPNTGEMLSSENKQLKHNIIPDHFNMWRSTTFIIQRFRQIMNHLHLAPTPTLKQVNIDSFWWLKSKLSTNGSNNGLLELIFHIIVGCKIYLRFPALNHQVEMWTFTRKAVIVRGTTGRWALLIMFANSPISCLPGSASSIQIFFNSFL